MRLLSLLFAPWSLSNNHFIAILRTLWTRTPCPLALGQPTPDRARMFVPFGFTTSTSVRMVASARSVNDVTELFVLCRKNTCS